LALRKLVYQIVSDFYWRERHVSLGPNNPDKTFFVIRYRYGGGLFGLINYFIPRIEYAVKNGYIPVIDMKNCRNMYLPDEQFKKVNAWEFFFEQPCGMSLLDVERSANVVLSSGGHELTTQEGKYNIFSDSDAVNRWRKLFLEYIIPNKTTSDYVSDCYKRTIPSGSRVLGVLCRGTDYLTNRPKNHPIQPDPDSVIRDCQELMRKGNFDKIFLATEDDSIYVRFSAIFGTKLLTTTAMRYGDIGSKYLPEVNSDRSNDHYLRGLEYFTTISILSRCNALVCGRTGGSIAAGYMGNDFEFVYCYDLGVYN